MSHVNLIMSEHDNKFIYKWLLSISRKICDLCSSGQEDVHILLDKCHNSPLREVCSYILWWTIGGQKQNYFL